MKRISPGTVTIGVLAIVFGLVAAYAARHLLAPGAAPQAAGPKMAGVVGPRVNLPKYARIRDQDVDLVQIPAEIVPQGAVQLKNRALFRLVKTTMLAGQPIMEENLYGVGEVPMLSDQLPPGHRAVTLTVDANSALNGMIQPESYVDISMTVNSDRPEVGGLATLTLLRAVKVLATSQSRFRASEDLPGNLRNVTVAVTPEEANKLILAQRYGSLSVTLRSTADGELLAQADTSTVDDGENNLVNPFDLLGISPLLPVPEPEEVETKTVQVWRAGQMQEITFQGRQIQEAQNATAVAQGHEPAAMPTAHTTQTTAAKKDCPACEKKKAAAAARANAAVSNSGTVREPQGTNQPTLAQPIRYQPETVSSMITIPVEVGN
jgi:pilus assembly protein CpaB